MKQKKIAHIFWGLGFGGIETMLVNIANAQTKYGAEVHIILINELFEETLLNQLMPSITVHLVNRKIGSKGLGFILKFNRILRKINPDAIHLHGPEFYPMILNRKYRRKTSLTLHALPSIMVRNKVTFWNHLLAKLAFGLYNSGSLIPDIPKLFAISYAVKDAFYDLLGVNSIVVANGIKTKNFALKRNRTASPILRVIQVGRLLHRIKGQDLLIKAASILRGQIDVTFWGDGESLEYLKKLAEELGVTQFIHFSGKQSQAYIADHLKDFDLFVQPSREEGFGLTVAEAMAANVPVLVASGQGSAEITENDKYGWVFANGDENSLAEQIKYISCHYDYAVEKSQMGREHVIEHYDVSVTAKRYLELY